MSVKQNQLLCLLLLPFLLLMSFNVEFTASASCDDSLLGVDKLPDSAFTATSNSEAVEQSIGGISPDVDHSAKTARLVC